MRIGVTLNHADGFHRAVDHIVSLEKVGIDVAAVAEAYSMDAVSQLGYLAARTSTVDLASAIFPIFTRSPTLLAMTAASLDLVSNGRFHMGIGASGPQVVEGFHGIEFDAPLVRTREVVEIARQLWRRERVDYPGKRYQVPLPPGRGTGLGKALRLAKEPLRERIPIWIAAMGPKNVELAAEVAEGWQPLLFWPEKADSVWGASLKAGFGKRDPALGALNIVVSTSLAIGDHVDERVAWAKPQLALYIGGMGAKGHNFYHSVATRYGFGAVADRIQELYLSGHRTEAIDAVPDELVRGMALIGPRGYIAERLAAFAESGVTTMLVNPLATTQEESVSHIEELLELVPR